MISGIISIRYKMIKTCIFIDTDREYLWKISVLNLSKGNYLK